MFYGFANMYKWPNNYHIDATRTGAPFFCSAFIPQDKD
jgi:hypothetical protein